MITSKYHNRQLVPASALLETSWLVCLKFREMTDLRGYQDWEQNTVPEDAPMHGFPLGYNSSRKIAFGFLTKAIILL